MNNKFFPGDEVFLVGGDEDDILVIIGYYELNNFGTIIPMYKVADVYGNALRYKESELQLTTDTDAKNAIEAYNRAMKII